jgi:hypothetical protein
LKHVYAVLCVLILAVSSLRAEEGWVDLFDGKTLTGWKANENPESFSVADGAIVTAGKPVGHLFYVGANNDFKPLKNFELKADLWTEPDSNSGIIFLCQFQEKGWIKSGFEAQVNNTYAKDPRKTGSLYAVKDVKEAPAKDGEWWSYHIKVEGKNIVFKVNDKEVMNYTEPNDQKPGTDFRRVIEPGTIALQAHDAHSVVKFKNIKLKRLAD